MKLVIYSPSSGIWGGGQIYIDQLCDYLGQKGINACIATSESGTFQSPSIAMPSVTSRFRRLVTSFALARQWKKKGFTHILLNDLSSVWLAPVFRAAGFQVSALLHLYLQRCSENSLGHSAPEFHAIRFTSGFVHRIFSVNKDNIAAIGPQVEFIGNFVPDWFLKAESEVDSEKVFDFIFVGRLAEQKNLPLFFQLLRNLKKEHGREYRSLLVGEGELEDRIREDIHSLGLAEQITIKPWVERSALPKLYDQGKVFVVTSYHEGFATTLLEAHARGLPAIVTRSSGFCAEFLEGYGEETGLVFEPSDVSSTQFLSEVAALVNGSDHFADRCREKARVFNEANVLGPIADYLLGSD